MPDDNFENDEQTSRDHVSRDDLKDDLPWWMFSRMNCGACRPGSRYQTQNKSWMSMARLALASKDLFFNPACSAQNSSRRRSAGFLHKSGVWRWL